MMDTVFALFNDPDCSELVFATSDRDNLVNELRTYDEGDLFEEDGDEEHPNMAVMVFRKGQHELTLHGSEIVQEFLS